MIKKIINKNLPAMSAYGQYNFDNSLENVSIDGQQQLYSLASSNNENVINLQSTNWKFLDTSTQAPRHTKMSINML